MKALFTPGIKLYFGCGLIRLFYPLSITSILIFFDRRVYGQVNVWVFSDLSI